MQMWSTPRPTVCGEEVRKQSYHGQTEFYIMHFARGTLKVIKKANCSCESGSNEVPMTVVMPRIRHTHFIQVCL